MISTAEVEFLLQVALPNISTTSDAVIASNDFGSHGGSAVRVMSGIGRGNVCIAEVMVWCVVLAYFHHNST
jgi:hypothetical protein